MITKEILKYLNEYAKKIDEANKIMAELYEKLKEDGKSDVDRRCKEVRL